MGRWGTGCEYCTEDHCICLLMAVLTYQTTQCFLENHRYCPCRGGEQVKDPHCISVLGKSGGGRGMNSTALVSSEKDQWLRQAAGFHVFDAGLIDIDTTAVPV